MTFEEFETKLRQICRDYETRNGRPVQTVQELEQFVRSLRFRPGRGKFVRSLKGLV